MGTFVSEKSNNNHLTMRTLICIFAIFLTIQWEVSADCCEKVRVNRALRGTVLPWKEQEQIFGVYENFGLELNNRAVSKNSDRTYAIWYTEGKWRIGRTERNLQEPQGTQRNPK